MIQVIGTYLTNNALQLETTEKVNGKKQISVVYAKSDMDRLYYYWVRLYIKERMSSFLKQRIYAYKIAGIKPYEELAKELLDTIQDKTLNGLNSICSFIRQEESNIIAIAPGPKSQQYKYYSKTIKSIIDYCKTQEGEIKK